MYYKYKFETKELDEVNELYLFGKVHRWDT